MGDTSGIKAGRAYVEVGTNSGPFNLDIAKIEKRLQAFGSNVKSIGKTLLVGGAALGGSLLFASKVFSDTGSQLDDMSQRTGVSVEALSELKYAFTQSGVETAVLEAAVKKLNKTLGDAENGEKSAVDSLRALGLTFEDLKGKTPDAQLEEVFYRLQAIKSIGQQTTAIVGIFGKSGADLLPLIGNIGALREEARRLGLVMSTEDAQAAAKLGDVMDRLKDGFQSMVNQIGAALAPELLQFGDLMVSLIKPTVEWMHANKAAVLGVGAVAAALFGAGAVLIPFGEALEGAALAVGLLGSGLALLLSPIGLVTAGIVGIGALILTQTDIGQEGLSRLGDSFGDLVGIVQTTMGGVSDAMKAGNMELVGEIIWQGLYVAWQTGASNVINGTMRFIREIQAMFLDMGAILKKGWDDLWIYLEGGLDRAATMLAPGLDAASVAKDAGIGDENISFGNGPSDKNAQLLGPGTPESRAADRQRRLDANLKRQVDSHAETDKFRTAADSENLAGGLGFDMEAEKAKLKKLLQQAEREADLVPDPDLLKQGKKIGQELPETAGKSTTKHASAAEFNSASAASSIARAANSSSGNVAKQTLEEAKKQRELLKTAVDSLIKLKNKPAIQVHEYA